MWTIGVCRGVWQYAPLSLSQKPRKSQKGDRLTQIKQIDRIIGTDLRNQRETIPVTHCERTLAEIADTAEAGTSGQDANHPSPQHHNRLVTSAINRVSGYSLCNLMLTTEWRDSPRLWLAPPQKKSPGGISEAVRYGIEADRQRHQARFTIARRRRQERPI